MCYISLAKEFNPSAGGGPNSEPRVDLLNMWGITLDNKHAPWEITWAPTVAGTNKHMWVRFPDLQLTNKEEQDKLQKIIVDWVEKQKMNVCKSFGGRTGITIVLADPQHVDSKTFIFHMMTWAATVKVLHESSKEAFNKKFVDFVKHDMMSPITVFEANGFVYVRKEHINLANTFENGKNSLNDSLKEIKQTMADQISKVQKEMRMAIDMLQVQMLAVTKSVTTLTGSVQQLQESNANMQCALLAQANEMALSRNLSDITTARITTHANWMIETDPEQKAELFETLKELRSTEKDLKSKIVASQNATHIILGGPLGLCFPPIHTPTTTTQPSMLAAHAQHVTTSQQLILNGNPTMSSNPMSIRIPLLKHHCMETELSDAQKQRALPVETNESA